MVNQATLPAAGELERDVIELASGLEVSATLASWLSRRGLSETEAARRFLAPRLAELTLFTVPGSYLLWRPVWRS
jgi:hypothetical protein